MTEQRRLAAILVADVVGYSKLIGSDEVGTLAQLQALRTVVIEPQLAKHAGRLFKAVGDGFLIEFASVVQAVNCAVAIQETNATGKLPLRIGIHVGDVVIQGDDLMGDGVNVAARIEGVAEAGGIAISRAVHEQVCDKLDFGFEDRGEVALKNLVRPVHVFAVASSKPTATPTPPLALPDKPSIAVLPFQNMSGDPEQEYFADGISEDVITALSRSRDFLVTARNSTFTYKGTSPDMRQVGRDLGVRYVLEGSVRRSADRLRITAQLIDATSGNHVWAERYDRPTADVFAIQDEITESVVASIGPQLLLAEGGRHKRNPPADLDAWGYVARAFMHRVNVSAAEARVALGFIERALEIDPHYAPALAEFAFITSVMIYNGWRVDREQGLEAATAAARKAISLDPDDPFAHYALGLIYRFKRRYEEALRELLKAVDLNPNYAVAHAHLGVSLAYVGRPDEGLEHAERALRISPRDPEKFIFLQSQAIVSFVAARYAEAIKAAQLARQQRAEHPNPLRILAASFALSGDVARAQAVVRDLRRLQPENSLAWIDSNIDAPDEPRGRILEGLRLAGLPE